MTVESFDPRGAGPVLTDDALARLLEAARRLDEPHFGLDAATARELAPLVRQVRPDGGGVDWAEAAGPLPDEDVLALVRLFTRAEAEIPAWEAGDASPVIPLVAELKRRGSYPAELTGWIKRNTDNRFLPYGNLMDRL